ncbi:NADH:flavin oxidoreductase/NADH oxidase family protein [Lactobacillus alvi]|uniref:NADH:flavin oxidoreductase/NADH oxidase family protein n=1 Tax=Limosilactobacillus alvi TaxID=990412 RepID=A0ABS2EQB4_9LACO|nr:NADH:flavin oxidoreductase/NADH oxidase family protein [Limosilactobacillus alvi]MBM6754697.1 NADH:flavin oxidoreductase/NADH oxidase family protein [Limosilactobacillus alvi]
MQSMQKLRLKNGLVIKNRVAKAATSETMGDRRGNPQAVLLNYYRKLVTGGSGLIISGNVMVDRTARGEMGNVIVDKQTDPQLLAKWAQIGESNGSHLWLQLNHPGRQAPKTVNKQPVAPSAIPLTGPNAFAFNPPRELTLPEIQQIIQRFVTASMIAEQAGFSGVEIHAAHGYLLSQFLSPKVNHRTDQYGGSLANRMRIITEIYDGIRARTKPNFAVAIKINAGDFTPGGFTATESLAVIRQLAARGIDLVEISGGSYENPKMMGTGKVPLFVEYARKVKAAVTVPVMVTGGFRTASGIEKAVATGAADLVGLARALVLEPNLPNKLAVGAFTAVAIPHFSTGSAKLDAKVGSLIGLAYYEQQMRRLGRHQSVKRPKTAWPILMYAMRYQGLAALVPQRGTEI